LIRRVYTFIMSRPHRIAVAVLCGLALLLLPGWVLRHQRAEVVHERRGTLQDIEAQNQLLRQTNDELLDRVLKLNEESERMEHEAREHLGWVKPNEVVVEFESESR